MNLLRAIICVAIVPAIATNAATSLTFDNQPVEQGTIRFAMTDYTVDENSGTAVITVSRTGGSAGMVSVTYHTMAGTATVGADYQSVSGTLVFVSGQTSRSFAIPILNDTLVESNETVSLILTNVSGGATFPDGQTSTSAALVIVDNDFSSGRFFFATNTYSVDEAAGVATITVNRTGGSVGIAAVDYHTVGDTATAGVDYQSVSGTLVFASGQVSNSIKIPILNDTQVEGNETVLLVLTNATGGATFPNGQLSATATLTILDDDLPSSHLNFSASHYSVHEAGSFATITVNRTGSSAGSVAVDYYTMAGTATAGVDYQSVSGRLIFASGQTTRSFNIPILDDTLVESNETVSLILTNVIGGATFPDGQTSTTATLLIVDNDFSAGRLFFGTNSNYSVSETASVARITVNRTGGSTGIVAVDYHTLGGTATAGVDYQSVSGTLVFASGQVSKSINIPILNDTQVEGNETVLLVLTNAIGGASFLNGLLSATATLTISDDDGPSIAQPVIEGLVLEGGQVRFHFTCEPPYDYVVEFRDATSSDWYSLTSFRAKVQTIEAVVTDSITNDPIRTYRIRKQECQCD
jgi:hypothetical protein